MASSQPAVDATSEARNRAPVADSKKEPARAAAKAEPVKKHITDYPITRRNWYLHVYVQSRSRSTGMSLFSS